MPTKQSDKDNKPNHSMTLFDAIRHGTGDEFLKLLETEDVNQRGIDDTTVLIELVYAVDAPYRDEKLETLLKHKDIEIDAVNAYGLTALSIATVRDKKIVRSLLDAGANPNVMTCIHLTDGLKQTLQSLNQWRRVSLLSAALNNYDMDTFELLLSFGADVNIVGDKDVSPMSIAAKRNDVATMTYLVDKAGAAVDVLPTNWREFGQEAKDVCGVALRKALKHGAIDALKYLLFKGVHVPSLIYHSNGSYDTPLTYVLSQPVWGVRKQAHEATARTLFRWMRLQNYLAVKTGKQPIYDLGAADSVGRTGLHYAAESYSAKLCQKLALSAIVCKADNNRITPLGIAVRRGALDIIEALLIKGANPNEGISFLPRNTISDFVNNNFRYEPAIFYAMRHKNEPMAEILLRFTPNLLWQNQEGKRPIDYLDGCFSEKFHRMLNFFTASQYERLTQKQKNTFARKYLKIRFERTRQ